MNAFVREVMAACSCRGRNLEVLLDAGLHDDGGASGHLHHLGVADPVGGRHNDFVARVDERQDNVADRLLRPVGANDLGRGVVQTVLAAQLLHDGVAQGWVAGHGRIARVVLLDGTLGGCLDVVGRVEIGFAHTQVDYVYPLCLQLGTLLRHGQGGRWRQAVDTF